MTDLTITRCAAPAELYRRYQNQSKPQPAYIELDLRTGRLFATYDSEVGGARPFSVRRGFDRRYPTPVLTAAAANRVMEEIRPLAERVLADWEETLDARQSNLVAVLGEDAAAAEEEIFKHLGDGFEDADRVAAWDIDGAVNGEEAKEFGITADTTDERLAEIAAEIKSALADCGESDVVVVNGLEEYLEGLRTEAAQEQDA